MTDASTPAAAPVARAKAMLRDTRGRPVAVRFSFTPAGDGTAWWIAPEPEAARLGAGGWQIECPASDDQGRIRPPLALFPHRLRRLRDGATVWTDAGELHVLPGGMILDADAIRMLQRFHAMRERPGPKPGVIKDVTLDDLLDARDRLRRNGVVVTRTALALDAETSRDTVRRRLAYYELAFEGFLTRKR